MICIVLYYREVHMGTTEMSLTCASSYTVNCKDSCGRTITNCSHRKYLNNFNHSNIFQRITQKGHQVRIADVSTPTLTICNVTRFYNKHTNDTDHERRTRSLHTVTIYDDPRVQTHYLVIKNLLHVIARKKHVDDRGEDLE